MTTRAWNAASFGRRYVTAALFYLGVALILAGTIQDPATTYAAACMEGVCGSGETCCQGTCIPIGYLCCGDGSYGQPVNCACCTECAECGGESTYVCEQ